MMPGPYPECRRETPPTANLAHRLKNGMFADIRPLSPPEVDADFSAMSIGVRSAEVLRHQLTVAEYALSPNGWLRQWFKAMARLAVLVVGSVLLIAPAALLLLGAILACVEMVNAIIHSLVSILVAALLVLLLIPMLKSVINRRRYR